MNALVVRDGKIERIELRPAADGQPHIRELIGGGFGSCFQAPGAGAERKIFGWCDDSFLLKTGADRPAWNVFLCDRSLYRGGCAIGGPIVIVGHYGPESVGMSEIELAAFRIASDRVWMGALQGSPSPVRLPVLTFLPGYDT